MAKLKYALAYGADAVYCGVPDFSLRVRINQFSEKDFKEAIDYTHKLGKKIYVTLNIYAHNSHLEKVKKHLIFLAKLGKAGFLIDAVIVSDPGIINLVKKHLPQVEIHLSTQANATNFEAVKFWRDAGVKRVILAREVSLAEIGEIRKKVKNVELEAFIHGAMCMSYSGRCILSKWMTGRSGNLGDCAQPCRWGYRVTQSVERETKELSVVDDQKRYQMDIEEDQHGTYFFNSYEMNMIVHVRDLIDTGISSLKIEGRAKSAYYLAVVTRAYRKVIDAVEARHAETRHTSSLREKIISEQKEELDKLTHRGYSTGFFFGSEPQHNFSNRNNETEWKYVGEVENIEGEFNIVRVHNEIFLSDELEIITPDENIPVKILRILDYNKKEVEEAHGGHANRYYFEFDKKLIERSLIRKKL